MNIPTSDSCKNNRTLPAAVRCAGPDSGGHMHASSVGPTSRHAWCRHIFPISTDAAGNLAARQIARLFIRDRDARCLQHDYGRVRAPTYKQRLPDRVLRMQRVPAYLMNRIDGCDERTELVYGSDGDLTVQNSVVLQQASHPAMVSKPTAS